MPASFFVGDLDSVESPGPAATELPSSQLTEIFLELHQVSFGEVRQVVNCEDYVLGLADGLGPPLNLSLTVDLQRMLTLRAAEQITPIRKFANFVAASTFCNRPFCVAMVQFTGDFMQSLLMQLTGDTQLMDGSLSPQFLLTENRCPGLGHW